MRGVGEIVVGGGKLGVCFMLFFVLDIDFGLVYTDREVGVGERGEKRFYGFYCGDLSFDIGAAGIRADSVRGEGIRFVRGIYLFVE